MKAEKYLREDKANHKGLPASAYTQQTPIWERNVSEEVESHGGDFRIETVVQPSAPMEQEHTASPPPKLPAIDTIAELLNLSSIPTEQSTQQHSSPDVRIDNLLGDDFQALPTSPSVIPPAFDPFNEPGFGGLEAIPSSIAPDVLPSFVMSGRPTHEVSAEDDEKDFDDELEHQLASFNISNNKPVTVDTPSQPFVAPTTLDDWGDDEDDESFGDPEN